MCPKPLLTSHIDQLKLLIKGEVYDDRSTRQIYSTDASAYKEVPVAVVVPRDERDVEMLVGFAARHSLPIIPRGAGTSLAGQVVGQGIVVDVSKYLNRILTVNEKERWVEVEPGVVLDELNLYLKQYGLFFGPETSTSNRCSIGGMVGNNSCGSRSLVYGSTRDHLLEVSGFLANGDRVVFGVLSESEYQAKLALPGAEGEIYRTINQILTVPSVRDEILKGFPHPEIRRRNTGYAIDLLVQMSPFKIGGQPINLCKLIAGSEGTLMFATKMRLNLLPLEPADYGLLCVHFNHLADALRANLVALRHWPLAVELMDKMVLDLAKGNARQLRNSFFVDGDPAALLLIELNGQSFQMMLDRAMRLIDELKTLGLGYAYPLLTGADIDKVWALRKAGLGVLSNIPGDKLPVPVIEDTAVRVEDLKMYLTDIGEMLSRHGKLCVYYGHVGAGELHLRPVLNMKDVADVKLFRTLAHETALIVKKYRGSLSGEHGDGRLRGEFMSLMLGERNYEILKQIKTVFDPKGIFNPGKITATPPMDAHLRYSWTDAPLFEPVFRWPKTGGLLQAADKCTGSADCRKSSVIGGTMCPSFKVTRHEPDTTRARANLLREYLTGNLGPGHRAMDEVKQVLDLCLMCKACKTECPSNVDVAKLKMEFSNHYRLSRGLSLRDRLFAYQPVISQWASKMPTLYNGLMSSRGFRYMVGALLKLDKVAVFPPVSAETVKKFFSSRKKQPLSTLPKVWLFADEFTDFHDANVGITCVRLLERLGYNVQLPPHIESGRTYLSKGLLGKAKTIANKNVRSLSGLVDAGAPLVGVEPSAILVFRDEYPDIVDVDLMDSAKHLARHTFTIEEFLWREMEQGRIVPSQFTDSPKEIEFHAHCYQKALSDPQITKKILEFPVNYIAKEIASGCCGMAGAFGYEAEHAEIARKIGELSLFPAIRRLPQTMQPVVSGTSCRAHIANHTSVKAVHPVSVLLDALK